jgi:phage-related protein
VARSATLVVKVIGDTSSATKSVDQASERMGKFGSTMQKMAVPAAIAGAAVIAFGKQAFDAASRTQQAMGAVDTVFGKSAGQVKAWAANAANSVGLAKSEYGELASVIGAQLKNLGVPMDQVAGKTNDLVKMGADLAATYGGTTAEAVEALSAVLKGETDPIEKYGISIKQATIDAEMAAEGTDKLTGAQAKAARTQATMNLLTKQAGPAMGAFAREADTAAGQQARMTANIENAKSAIGQGLLPVVALLAGKLATVAKWVEQNSTLVAVLIGVIGGLAAAVLAINAAMRVYQATLIVVQAVQKATWLSALGPIGLVIAAVLAVVAVIVVLWKKSETFRRIVLAVWGAIKTSARAVAAFVKAVWSATWSAVSGYVRTYLAVTKMAFSAIKSAVSAVTSWMKSAWRSVSDAVRSAISAIRDTARAVFSDVRSAISETVSKVQDLITWFSKIVVKAIPTGPLDAVRQSIEWLIGKVQSLISWLSKIHVPKINLPGPLSLGAAVVSPITTLGAARTTATPVVGGRGAAGPVVVNINGALDPEAVARQVKRILNGHGRRVGTVTV